MLEQKKKTVPKFKKKLVGFLSDESGKITKEDILKIGLVTMGVASMGIELTHAGHSDSFSGLPGGNSHTSGNGGNCHGNGPWSATNSVNGHANVSGTAGAICHGGSAGHGSVSHGSHGSHGSHAQW